MLTAERIPVLGALFLAHDSCTLVVLVVSKISGKREIHFVLYPPVVICRHLLAALLVPRFCIVCT